MAKSGSVRVDDADEAEVSCVSGTVYVTGVTARVRAVSSSISVAAAGDVSAETVSGNIAISLPAGLHPRVLSKSMRRPVIEVDQGRDCEISVRSVSGSITIRSR
jgi:DUF4097 and DUF4098 domain-containing protein YvlB